MDGAEQLHDLGRLLAVQVAGGFIREQQARLGHERARDAHQLLLPTRELARVEFRARGERETIERRGDAGLALGPLHVAISQRHLEVLGHRQVVE